MDDLKRLNPFSTAVSSPRKLTKAFTSPRNRGSSTDFTTVNYQILKKDRGSDFRVLLTKCSDSYTEIKSSRFMSKTLNKLPERLNFLKQITENKIKFRRIEQEINELKLCTFHPKINTPTTRVSLTNFSKQQDEYRRSRNSKRLQLNFQYATTCSSYRIEPRCKKAITLSNVHEKLYLQSRVFSKITKFVKHYS